MKLLPVLFQLDLNGGVCTHVFRIKMQNLKRCEAPAADVPWGAKLGKLNAENSFKSVATSLTAHDNDDDTIPSKPLAADKSGHGMQKNSFLNGHKGAVSTSARWPSVGPRLKIFLKAGRSWHAEISYPDILLRLNCFILCVFLFQNGQ